MFETIKARLRIRRIYRLCKRAQRDFEEVEKLMAESGLAKWKKRQIRRDLMKGNPSVLGE